MNPHITEARAMIERLDLEESAFYIAGDSDAASTVRSAMRCIQSLITLALRGEQDIADAVCDEKPYIQRDALEMAAKRCGQMGFTPASDHFEAGYNQGVHECVDAIRALITGKDKP